jgi:uncharacterized protein YjbI with pentapeptide repeats
MSKRSLPKIKTIRRLLKWLITILALIVILGLLQPTLWPGGSGIGKDQSISTKSVETVEKDAQGKLTKTVQTTKHDDGKTLWDWLSVLGVPLSLAILGYWLQMLQQNRAIALAEEQKERDEKLAENQRKIAADETKEEVLQRYFDRLSELLVDKNLLAIAAKKDQATDEERELLASAMDVVRARTLSILRRFEKDPERKTSVMRFLIEAGFIRQLHLYLSGADLRGVDLSSGADLCNANLMKADLSNADLSNASCSRANLSNANLSDANLMDADLSNSNLSSANLSNADLRRANLIEANLSSANLMDADLSHADFMDANLSHADFMDANLSNADFFNTNLSHTDLSNANNLTAGQLQSAKFCHTKLPENITRDSIYPDPNRDCETLGFSEN